MQAYLSHTAALAAATPDARNRIVDFWRTVAIGVVVVGHWLAASIWVRADGSVALLNSLEWVPYAGWVTWLVQVMPVFFLAGGYANARSLRRVVDGEQRRREWITLRVRRLWTPVTPLLAVWIGLVLALRPFLDADIVFAGAMSATVPLWFLAVYISLTAIAPFTYSWWRRSGSPTIVILMAGAVAVDLLRFAAEVPGIGWVNFAFVWAAVHQVGYWWSERDAAGGISVGTGWSIAGAALGLLVVVTWAGWYPVAMVGIPGSEVTNMTPPTAAMALLGSAQAGLIWATAGPVGRLVRRLRVWHAVVSVSGLLMTVYLWHLTAMSLVAAAGIVVADGIVLSVEPGTVGWWATRPVWLLALGAVTLLLVAVFARFEIGVSRAPAPGSAPRVAAGVLLVAGSAAAVAMIGLTDRQGVLHWSIPGAAVLGAVILGAVPRRPQP